MPTRACSCRSRISACALNALIDTSFLLKTAETIRLGTGIPQIFNDEVVVPAFLNRGVSLEDARDYAVVGCVELSIPGQNLRTA
ncbi:Pyruvate formate-lyase [Salmonella enterica subsp. enterica serovar Daytona]|uniref:Pyruvate formate-lyase n=1 Tax=Salmonella enterica subsp. enterica serovar Daytona TaxID=1962639 RepID=A0A447JQH8_SALET|nr:Pyruvate formate-lyase [Salmonella enterica subsp. enterica serovar Daytona]